MERILIIDDEPQIRSMLRLMLERDGYEVVEKRPMELRGSDFIVRIRPT